MMVTLYKKLFNFKSYEYNNEVILDNSLLTKSCGYIYHINKKCFWIILDKKLTGVDENVQTHGFNQFDANTVVLMGTYSEKYESLNDIRSSSMMHIDDDFDRITLTPTTKPIIFKDLSDAILFMYTHMFSFRRYKPVNVSIDTLDMKWFGTGAYFVYKNHDDTNDSFSSVELNVKCALENRKIVNIREIQKDLEQIEILKSQIESLQDDICRKEYDIDIINCKLTRNDLRFPLDSVNEEDNEKLNDCNIYDLGYF